MIINPWPDIRLLFETLLMSLAAERAARAGAAVGKSFTV